MTLVLQSSQVPAVSHVDHGRLNLIVSAPRGGALSLARRMHGCGHVGLPHTHLLARNHHDLMTPLKSPLDLYQLDDGLIRTLSGIIYGGYQPRHLEAACHDLAVLSAQEQFSVVYSRLLSKTDRHIFDPSFSLSLYPELVSEAVHLLPGVNLLFLFRDPFFYAPSVLSSIHGLDSLILWWNLMASSEQLLDLDPLEMWCCLNESLLKLIEDLPPSAHFQLLRFPESVGRYSGSRLSQALFSKFSQVPFQQARNLSTFSCRISATLAMTPVFRHWFQPDMSTSPIDAQSAWWIDLTQGGDPSANIEHFSNPLDQMADYWMALRRKADLLSRCDRLCGILGFPLLSSRFEN